MEGIQVYAYGVGSSGNIAIIQVGGYIDNVTSAQLELAIADVISQGMNKVIVDLASVSYISSAGWGVFLGKIKGLREKGGDLVIAQMIPDVLDVFELLEFHRVLKVFETTESAVSYFEATPQGNATVISEDKKEGTALIGDGKAADMEFEEGSSVGKKLLSPEVVEDLSREREKKRVDGDFETNLLSLTDEGDENVHVTPAEEDQGDKEPAVDNRIESDKDQLTIASFYDSLGISTTMMDRELPLNEKIKLLVIDNPLSGVWKIRNALNSSRFGYTKVSLLEVRRILKELDLDTKQKRYRFWRSR